MFFSVIKTWSKGKIIPIILIIGGLLVASTATFFVLYKVKSSQLEVVNQQVVTITKENGRITAEYQGLQNQLADERKRHAELEAAQRKSYDDYVQRQADLEKKKNDAAKKAAAKKNPKVYEAESQKITNDYMNRMNCLSGNSVSCSNL